MSATVFTITPEARERRLDWVAIRKRREQEGIRWAEADGNARQIYLKAMERLAETAAEAAIAKRMLEMGK